MLDSFIAVWAAFLAKANLPLFGELLGILTVGLLCVALLVTLIILTGLAVYHLFDAAATAFKTLTTRRKASKEPGTLKHTLAFLNGMREFRSDFTAHYKDRSLLESYDWGREWAHRLTSRYYE